MARIPCKGTWLLQLGFRVFLGVGVSGPGVSFFLEFEGFPEQSVAEGSGVGVLEWPIVEARKLEHGFRRIRARIPCNLP